MARILMATILAALAVSALLLAPVVQSTTWYSSKLSTGYAMGSYTGASSWLGELYPGHFANHTSTYCSGDPAAYWPYGTWITAMSPNPTMYQGDGTEFYPTAFSLKDIGDFACNGGNYWSDLYFGRYRPSTDSCDCNNGTEYCYISSYVNNCQDATVWGATYVGYYGPD